MNTLRSMPSIEAKTISVVCAILHDLKSNKVLITQRQKHQHLSGFWEFPGGKIESNETHFQALQREIFEEVGLKIHSAKFLKSINYKYPDRKVKLSFYHVFEFDGYSLPKEGQKMDWVDPINLDEYSFPEANQSILTLLKLSPEWLITSDCDFQNINGFINNLETSITHSGVSQVLFRSKNLSNSEYYQVADKIKNICEKHSVNLILNRELIDTKNKSNFAWHLTSKQLFQFQTKPIINETQMLSASCHTLNDIKQAECIGCDFILLSAVNKTSSHPDAKALGWDKFESLCEQTKLPVYALGGISRGDLDYAKSKGAFGIAGISMFKF